MATSSQYERLHEHTMDGAHIRLMAEQYWFKAVKNHIKLVTKDLRGIQQARQHYHYPDSWLDEQGNLVTKEGNLF